MTLGRVVVDNDDELVSNRDRRKRELSLREEVLA